VAIKPARRSMRSPRLRVFQGLKEGFAYAFGVPRIRSILLLLALVSVTGRSYSALMPLVAANALHGDSRTLGLLMGASGVGALAGALYLASRQSARSFERKIRPALAVVGAALMVLPFSPISWLSAVLMLFVGGGLMVHLNCSNVALQADVEDAQRGRVMSLYAMAFTGMMPFGSLLAGFVASRAGASAALMIAGGVCILGAIIFAASPADMPRRHAS